MNLQQFQKGRLRSAREARGLSGVALADLVGVHKSAVSQYEHGHHVPSIDTLRVIADKLRLPMQHFFLPVRSNDGIIYWRSQAAATKTERTRAARRYEWLVSVTDYLSSFLAFPKVNFPHIPVSNDPRDFTDELIESVAGECRRFWALGCGPISNLVLLIENHGAVVVRCSFESNTLDAFSQWNGAQDRPYFVLGTDKGMAARSLTNLAHEIAHMILHRDVEARLFNSGEVHKLMEHQAMVFAGAFLLPATTFAADLYSISPDAFVTVKAKWRVSVQSMIMRASHLGIVTADEAKSLWIRLARRGWRQREPLDDTLEVEQPRMLQRCFDMLLDRGFDVHAMAAVLALPIDDIEGVCGLPPTYLDGHGLAPLKFRAVG